MRRESWCSVLVGSLFNGRASAARDVGANCGNGGLDLVIVIRTFLGDVGEMEVETWGASNDFRSTPDDMATGRLVRLRVEMQCALAPGVDVSDVSGGEARLPWRRQQTPPMDATRVYACGFNRLAMNARSWTMYRSEHGSLANLGGRLPSCKKS